MLVPRAGGVLSALGLAISDLRRDYVSPFLADLEDVDVREFEERFEDMEEHGRRRPRRAGAHPPGGPALRGPVLRDHGRGRGSFEEAGGPLPCRTRATLRLPDGRRERRAGEPAPDLHRPRRETRTEEPQPEGDAEAGRREANFDGEWLEVPVLDRERMGEGSEVDGPAIVEFKEATCVVRPGWRGTVDGVGTLVLERE